MRQWKCKYALVLVALFSVTAYAEPVPPAFNWVFSGIVSNDAAERYGFYFQIQRTGEHYQVLTTLLDLEKHRLVFIEENKADLPESTEMNWQVDDAYLGFKPINNSWVFGVKTKSKQGFNFKIDTLSANEQNDKTQRLRPGLLFFVKKTGRLTGHLHLGEEKDDEFVTAKSAWFRQLSSQMTSNDQHHVTNMLCQFEDGSGFYATHLLEQDALRGFVAGWRDASGKSVSMSQFVKMKYLPNHAWQISSAYPNVKVEFSDMLVDSVSHTISAGIVEGKRFGFCAAGRETV